MSPVTRFRVLDAMVELVPVPMDDGCCDPNGGCPTPHECRLALCEKLLEVVERESQ